MQTASRAISNSILVPCAQLTTSPPNPPAASRSPYPNLLLISGAGQQQARMHVKLHPDGSAAGMQGRHVSNGSYGSEEAAADEAWRLYRQLHDLPHIEPLPLTLSPQYKQQQAAAQEESQAQPASPDQGMQAACMPLESLPAVQLHSGSHSRPGPSVSKGSPCNQLSRPASGDHVDAAQSLASRQRLLPAVNSADAVTTDMSRAHVARWPFPA